MSWRGIAIGSRRWLGVASVVAAGLVQVTPSEACSTSSPPLTAEQIVDRATTIVHVRLSGICGDAPGSCLQLDETPPTKREPYAPGFPPVAYPPGENPFTARLKSRGGAFSLLGVEVIEVLKGRRVTGSFAIRGYLDQRDDFNDHPSPYKYARPGSRGGPCHAYNYKRGAEYLLFLRNQHDVLTPYWAPSAAINEQVRSTDDPWIAWVRARIARK
jgi:hypothetical protein